MSQDPIVIVGARRTPIGAFQGALSKVSATDLGAAAIRAVLADTGIDGADVNEVLMGCVLPAGLGQAPARQAALAAGLPIGTSCTTVNKVCGSGMKTVMIGHDGLLAGSSDIVIAGGMESMSNAPYLLPKARSGYRLGHQEVLDHMFFDGLQSPFDGNMMGTFAEATARRYEFQREQQDAYAIESVQRALNAVESGAFDGEIATVEVHTRKGTTEVSQDEEPFRCDIERIPTMRPAFASDGTVTAATSSSISDGAAAVALMRESQATRRGLKPLARIHGHASFAHEPEWFTTAPPIAIRAVQKIVGWDNSDVDLYEINEAFAVVTMAALRDLDIGHDKVNIHGGACALGHPIGATGCRMIVTLIAALRTRGLQRGIASQCIGGGEATAIAIEVLA